MKTPRNNLEVIVMRGDDDMLAEIDTVYEICDAEFTSDKRIYDTASAIIKANRHPEPPLTEALIPEVMRVARQNGFMAGSKPENYKSVAGQLAADINASLGADIRRERKLAQADHDSPSP